MVAFCQGLVLFAGQLLFSASYPVRVHIGFVLYCKGVKQYMISTAAALLPCFSNPNMRSSYAAVVAPCSIGEEAEARSFKNSQGTL